MPAKPNKPGITGTRDSIEQALSTAVVKRSLHARAARLLPRAQRMAHKAMAPAFADALRIEDGVRPGSKASDGLRRPYSRVVAQVTDEIIATDAGASLTRKQILRRSTSG